MPHTLKEIDLKFWILRNFKQKFRVLFFIWILYEYLSIKRAISVNGLTRVDLPA